MGTCLVLEKDVRDVQALAEAGRLGSTVKLVHKPLDSEGQPSLWPYGLTDGVATGWFEEPNYLHFWGGQNYLPLRATLKQHGIRVIDSF